MSNNAIAIGTGLGVAAIAGVLLYLTSGGGQGVIDTSTDVTPSTPAPASASDAVQNFASAIAFAEGFWDENENVNAGNIPALANNPGDLAIPGWTGGSLGEGISIFPSLSAGWAALWAQLQLILSGGSRYYSKSMTISEMGQAWAGDPVNWPENVVFFLNQNFGAGVTINTPLSEVLS